MYPVVVRDEYQYCELLLANAGGFNATFIRPPEQDNVFGNGVYFKATASGTVSGA